MCQEFFIPLFTCDAITMPMCRYLCTSGHAALYDVWPMALPHISGHSALHTWIRIQIWPHPRLPWWRIRPLHLMWSVSDMPSQSHISVHGHYGWEATAELVATSGCDYSFLFSCSFMFNSSSNDSHHSITPPLRNILRPCWTNIFHVKWVALELVYLDYPQD